MIGGTRGGPAVWGRGAIGIKHNVVMQLQAVEEALQKGVAPKRMVYFAYGHDEEVGGAGGARHIARHLAQQRVELGARCCAKAYEFCIKYDGFCTNIR